MARLAGEVREKMGITFFVVKGRGPGEEGKGLDEVGRRESNMFKGEEGLALEEASFTNFAARFLKVWLPLLRA